MTLSEIKIKIKEALLLSSDEIIALGEEVLKNPELGYKEEATSALVRRVFDGLEIEYEYPLALTGVKARLKGKKSNRNVCIISEMDALLCQGHPYATADYTAHACGHHAQVAAMLGAAMAIKRSGVMSELDGDVTLFAVPAEEFIDIAYRQSLKDAGKIEFFGGKQQLIYEGAFDDVDMAMMIHAKPCEPENKIYCRGQNLGFIAKTITFYGKAAHGSTPFYGTNALNAAALAIIGLHSNRETFKDEEKIRIHPIITKGGSVVNSVPDEVCIDTYVRGATLSAIQKGDAAVERSVAGAAQIIGATSSIDNIPGYLPIIENELLSEVFERNARQTLGENSVVYGEDITGSTDMGDLSYVMPIVQPSIGGFTGQLHSTEFTVTSKDTAYLSAALILATTAAELLYDGAAEAEKIVKNCKPKLTKKEYISYLKGEQVNVD